MQIITRTRTRIKSKPKLKTRLAGIYIITNSVNGMRYVGQSTDLESRWRQHLLSVKKPVHTPPVTTETESSVSLLTSPQKSSLLAKAMREFGVENFAFDIIEIVEELYPDWRARIDCPLTKRLFDLERFYIQEANTLAPHGYNACLGTVKKTTEEQDREIIARYQSGECEYCLSAAFNISTGAVISRLYHARIMLRENDPCVAKHVEEKDAQRRAAAPPLALLKWHPKREFYYFAIQFHYDPVFVGELQKLPRPTRYWDSENKYWACQYSQELFDLCLRYSVQNWETAYTEYLAATTLPIPELDEAFEYAISKAWT